MKKIPTIFKRNPEDMRSLLNEHHELCEWVFAGDGLATRKYDGTCCLIRDGDLYKRREIKKGKPTPDGFLLADFDEITGKTVGWLPVDENDNWHKEAFILMRSFGDSNIKDGTYELVGPKVQGNLEDCDFHMLINHNDADIFIDVPRNYDGIKEWLADKDIEGLVFHHEDGRMAKIKKRDFGLKR